MKISQVAELKSCLTCVYRKPYPSELRDGQPVFRRFICGLAMDSQKTVVEPGESCEHWKGVTLDID